MTNKSVRMWLICCFALFVVFANTGIAKAAQPLAIDTVDGQKYNPAVHKHIVARVIYRHAVNGQHVLGFSSLQKYHAYLQQHQPTHQAAARQYFYENTSFDPNGLGANFSLAVGANSYFVGNWWNDRISALNIAGHSYVTLYQDWHYEGQYTTFYDNGSGYWFLNLTDYYMSNGTNWNDQASSIKTGW